MSHETAATGGGADGAGQAESGPAVKALPAAELGPALEAIQRSALQLLAGFPRPPTLLRVRAGELTVEVEWRAEKPATMPAVPAERPGASPTARPPVAEATEAPVAEAQPDDRHYVRAPTVGVFYRAPESGAEPFVAVGDTVVPDQQIGIVEAMKLMIPVNADVHGRVVEVLTADGASVEYDDPLFSVVRLDAT